MATALPALPTKSTMAVLADHAARGAISELVAALTRLHCQESIGPTD